MKYLLVENEEGEYTNKQGKKYDLLECNEVVGQRANEFVEFANLEEAKKAFDLK